MPPYKHRHIFSLFINKREGHTVALSTPSPKQDTSHTLHAIIHTEHNLSRCYFKKLFVHSNNNCMTHKRIHCQSHNTACSKNAIKLFF